MFTSGKQEAGVWSSGHYTDGAELIDKIMSGVQNQVALCDNLEGFAIFSSVSGGSGGGLGSLIASKLKENYLSKTVFGVHTFPSPSFSNNSLEIYNTILSLHR